MPNEPLKEAKIAEAAHATAVAHQATSEAREVQIHETLYNVFREILTEGDEGTKKLLIQKIPLLCTDIMTLKNDVKHIKGSMEGMKSEVEKMNEAAIKREDFLLLQQRADLTTKLVFGAVGLILTAFILGLLVLVFKS